MTDETPFLIAHKVRGEPAFDIAIKLQIGDEEGWIIPTSGHRAHPYWSFRLDDLLIAADDGMAGIGSALPKIPDPPADWPDHYACNDRLKKKKHYPITEIDLEELDL